MQNIFTFPNKLLEIALNFELAPRVKLVCCCEKRSGKLQKSHGYADIDKEGSLLNGRSVKKVSCQNTT